MKEPGFAYTVMTKVVLVFHIMSLVQPRLNISIHGSKVLETVKKETWHNYYSVCIFFNVGQDSSVGSTRYGLDGPGIESR
jgi:uncharacterized membrane protein